ncbi:UNVERIFIED_CONTAM: hypothetical protein NCL1_48337 [Trichonephila clavipes]
MFLNVGIIVNHTSNTLHDRCLFMRRLAICVPFTSRHIGERLQWTRQHVHRKRDQWKAVIFTYESRFRLESDSGRIFYLEKTGNSFSSVIHPEKDAYGSGSVCV